LNDLTSFISFTNKASKLLNTTFAKEMVGKTSVDLSWADGKQVAVHKAPNEEFVDAFVLTFRFFIQSNESISFKSMSTKFESKIVSEEIKNLFIDARLKLNNYLDTNTMFDIDGIISKRKILDVFVYGELSHTTPVKKKTYDKWMSNEFMAPLLQHEFRIVLHDVLHIITFVSGLSKQVILNAKRTGISGVPH